MSKAYLCVAARRGGRAGHSGAANSANKVGRAPARGLPVFLQAVVFALTLFSQIPAHAADIAGTYKWRAISGVAPWCGSTPTPSTCYDSAAAACQAFWGTNYLDFRLENPPWYNNASCQYRNAYGDPAWANTWGNATADIVCPANSTGTPVLNQASCTCNDGYEPDPTRTRCVPNQYTVTIEPNGTYLPNGATCTIEPSTILPLKAVVKDQNGIAKSGVQVSLSASVKDGTGGHVHTANRPKGDLSCSLGPVFSKCPAVTTDGFGEATFAFHSTAMSGEHAITATCDRCSNTATAPIKVMVENLIPIPASKYYALQDSTGAVIGAFKDKHPANHYLTNASVAKLADFAEAYQKTVNPGAKLYLNDASLEWGGLFDVGDAPWVTPHTTHRRGAELDIRAENSGVNVEGAVPSTLFASVSKEAAKAKAKAALHCTDKGGILQIGTVCNGIPNNRHFHVDF